MRITSFFLLSALLVLPTLAHADVANKDPQVSRLLDAKKTLKWNYVPPGKSERYGHAEALVAAPADKVAKTASDFASYSQLHKKFATARVVAKDGDNTDVFMRYPVYVGPVKITFDEVMRFAPMRTSADARILEGKGIRGDMKQGHAVITIKPVDATHSLLQVDVLFLPNVPAPQSLIDSELREGAVDFVNGLKDRAQGWVGSVSSL